MSDHNRRLGSFGENAAADWYLNHGYDVCERNWRVREGEIDLICELASPNHRVVIFVEVKTRSSARFGGGYVAVDQKKQRKLRQLAMIWLAGNTRFFDELRFDVVDVDARGHLQVWEAAF